MNLALCTVTKVRKLFKGGNYSWAETIRGNMVACFVNSNNIFFFCFSAEEMACLATWKEGSSRYFVSMLNHSHVYTDETRYRCFVYQRQHSNELGRVTYKMAQSLYASCLGLWNVNEGHKTFTMTKCKLFLFCFFFFNNQ